MAKVTKSLIEKKVAKYINLLMESKDEKAKLINKKKHENSHFKFVAETVKANLPEMDSGHKAKYEKLLAKVTKVHNKFIRFINKRIALYKIPK